MGATDQPDEGLRAAAALVGRPWTVLIIGALATRPRRFGELADAVTGISTNLLTERLRQLTTAGVVARSSSQGSAVVVYRLTDAGKGLAPIVHELARWGQGLRGTRSSR